MTRTWSASHLLVIGRYPLLAKHDEVGLVRSIEAGDEAR